MAGVALLLDLLKKSPTTLPTQVIHSCGLFSATVAASAAAASISAGRPFLTRVLFGDGGISVSLCDAATEVDGEYIPSLRSASHKIVVHKSLRYSSKEYPIELKPLFSAFGLKSLAITSLRSFLMFYLPLLEPRPPTDEDDDFPQDAPEEEPVDLVIPFKKSVKQIFRETTVVTTRRVLERLVIHYISHRMAWKLLKDIPKSAKRKAERGMPTLVFLCSVSRTTFRGHLLGIVASWLVQVGIEVYRCLVRKSDDDKEEVDIAEKIQLLGRRIYGATIKCGASLLFASIGGGIGAFIHPSTGQWIGCVLGDFAGPFIVEFCFEKILHRDI